MREVINALQTLRNQLRWKKVQVMGAGRFRNQAPT